MEEDVSQILCKLYEASENGDEERVREFIDRIPPEGIPGGTSYHRIFAKALIYAAYENHVGVIDAIMMSQAHVLSHDLDFALQCATGSGHTEAVQRLIEHGANVSTEDQWPLRTSIHQHYMEILALLLKAGADVYARNGEPLKLAMASERRAEFFHIFIDHGVDDQHPVLLKAFNKYPEMRAQIEHMRISESMDETKMSCVQPLLKKGVTRL